MNRKFIKSITILASVALSFTLIGGINVQAATSGSASITKIVANTYVGDVGQMVDSFEITVDDIKKVSTLKASDFDITSNYDGYSEKDGSYKSYANDGITLTTSGNTIKMDVKDFKYSGAPDPKNPTGPVIPFNVTSVKYPTLNFNATKVTNLVTKTVDKFEKLTFTGSNGVTIPYRLYSANTGKAEPLVIWMHGAGEVGTDNVKPVTANRGAVAFAESGYATNVIAAQYPYVYSRDLTDSELKDMNKFFDAYEELINKLVADGKVDKNRIYVTGASMGGGLTLRFLLAKPNLFAASVAIATRNTVKDLSELKSIKTLPIWLFHCADDGVNTSKTTTNIYNELKNLGDDKARLTLYTPAFMDSLRFYGIYAHHASWVPALNTKNMMYWLFSQTKAATSTLPTPTDVKVSFVLSWNGVSGATGYEVSRSTTIDSKYSTIATTTTTSYKDTTLVKGTSYYYKVRAYKVTGGVKVYSNWSEPIIAKV